MSTSAKPLIPNGHVLWHFRHAAASGVSAEQHVWHLELGMSGLLDLPRTEVIPADQRTAFDAALGDARRFSERLLPCRYPAEQIATGYRAAHGVVALAAAPAHDRHRMDPVGACRNALTCFRADLGNMRRWNTLAERAPGVALDVLLPPLSEPSPNEACQVLPFPYSKL
ncbi:hypothetical protein [Methylobacterium sp. Leaf111]|uniref:hypothetical protein n=1 Tax=Methylobacterium sp. Leaf111 TaxID=1736257 RepID=UPI0012E84618|nr:hypothetical protein [Methylobacterium sp. Leaf111]